MRPLQLYARSSTETPRPYCLVSLAILFVQLLSFLFTAVDGVTLTDNQYFNMNMLFTAVDDVTLTQNQYSYQHVKSFGKHNHLVVDPWNPHLVFFVDDLWKVRKFTVLSVSLNGVANYFV